MKNILFWVIYFGIILLGSIFSKYFPEFRYIVGLLIGCLCTNMLWRLYYEKN